MNSNYAMNIDLQEGYNFLHSLRYTCHMEILWKKKIAEQYCCDEINAQESRKM